MDLGNGTDVNAAGRLVEDDDQGILRQRLGDHDLLLIAAGKFDDARLALQRGDLQPLDPVARELVAHQPRYRKLQPALVESLLDIDIVVDAHGLEEAVGLAIFGDVAMPSLIACFGTR